MDYDILTLFLTRFFSSGKERIIINKNFYSGIWSLCDSNKGVVKTLTLMEVVELKKVFEFEVYSIDEYFICIQSVKTGSKLLHFLNYTP